MTESEHMKSELHRINNQISDLLEQAKSLPVSSDKIFSEWEETCRRISEQLEDDIVRVAVVGAIKSGKSTLINAMLSGDYLRRGAGVITSMVTRLRRGPELKARLYFKSWGEVNSDIKKSLSLFPSRQWQNRTESFDIRNDEHRKELESALGSLSKSELVSSDTRNLNTLYLSSYLQGYERVKDIIGEENTLREFSGEEFLIHQEFSGNDVLAFYLKDILLETDSDSLGPDVEIADCQGSDSPNPLHLAMIQDYLLSANLLVYVISSRTGIRQADINFLSMIRRMGFIEHIVFAVNFDFNEHESMQDLDNLLSRVREDLRIIRNSPQVYSFSALYSLFKSIEPDLAEKDRLRFAQWRKEKEFASFSDSEEKGFISQLHETVTRQRMRLLLKAPLDRLSVICSGLLKWCRMNRDVLRKGSREFSSLIEKIKSEQKRINHVQSMIQSTVDGAIQKIKNEIKKDVDEFLDPRYGEAAEPVLEFVKNYSISTDRYSEQLSSGRFSDALYMVFQEFTHELDSFMAENVNPRIFNFIKTREQKISELFESITGPYEKMVEDAAARYNSALKSLGLETGEENTKSIKLPDIQLLKKEQGLEIPPAATTMNYSAAIKTEAVMRFGVYSLAGKIKKFFRRSEEENSESRDRGSAALKAAVKRIKKETEQGVSFQFKNYKENIKFQYLFVLVDAFAERLHEEMMNRFYDFTNDLVKWSELTDRQKGDEADLIKKLDYMADEASRLEARIKETASKVAS